MTTRPGKIAVETTALQFPSMETTERLHGENIIHLPEEQNASTTNTSIFHQRATEQMLTEAVSKLASSNPEQSAKRLLTGSQAVIGFSLFAALTVCIIKWPVTTFVFSNIVTVSYFTCAIIFRLLLLALGWEDNISARPSRAQDDEELPLITILLPLYRDAAALPILAQHIDALDYPRHKKDVKLLLEEDDAETINEAVRLNLGHFYDIILIPPCEPRTKPKACNIGLQLARGDYIVIYDAEDQPEPDQLRKVTMAFSKADAKLACVQARLNYYNRDDNWLTRLFTLEYSLWFDWLLPGLQKMRAPIPLGGTSNFFDTQILRKVGGWDPYNVTEDADLGLRLARHGYRVELINSTTFEEANCKTGNWLRQRSRWLKGYIQTWLVHMRHPQKIIAATGWRGFLAVQLFVAGNVFSALINPIMWGAFFVLAAWGPPSLTALFPAPLIWLNLFALIAGNLLFILMMVIGPLKRGWRELALYGLTAPAYWLLSSLAAYKALWQAIIRPHYWEKTDHIICDAARKRREIALAEFFDEQPPYDRRRIDNANPFRSRRTALSENERARELIHHSGSAK